QSSSFEEFKKCLADELATDEAYEKKIDQCLDDADCEDKDRSCTANAVDIIDLENCDDALEQCQSACYM
ncbi:hypothetical protein BGZ68_004699, partial [Mortierella alpina]